MLEKLFDGEPNNLDEGLDKSSPDGDHRHDESGQVVEFDELLPAAVGGFAGCIRDV